MANNYKLTPKRRERFLECLREQPNVSRAARAIAVSRMSAYKWRRADPKFAEEWDEAIEVGCDRLEEEAWRRAHDGIERDVYYQGEVVGQERHYSDRLMERLLEAHRPDKYRKNVGLSTPDGPLGVVVLPPEDPAPE